MTTDQSLAAELSHLRPSGSLPKPLTALCLSGGGIRSAAFALGVLQSLAAKRLLSQFDYLSTVSGGGFIGGWLQVLIQQKGSASAAEAALQDPSAPEVTRLRSYTNYLTPEGGLFSADTWTAVALYLRNLLLNWLVIVPVLVLPVLVLVFHRTAVAGLGAEVHTYPAYVALAVAMGLLFTAAFQACRLLPSHRPQTPEREYASSVAVRGWIVYPSFGWALVAPVALNPLLATVAPQPWPSWRALGVLPVCYAAVMLGAYGAAWFAQRRSPPVSLLFQVNAWAWAVATLLATAALLTAELCYLKVGSLDQAQALTTFAPLILILCHMLQAVIHVGLRGERTFADIDREWIARMNGIVILYAAAWTACSLCCLDLSGLLISNPGTIGRYNGPSWAVGIATFLGGPAVAWFGKQAVSRVGRDFSAGSRSQWPLRRLLNLGCAVFAIGLFGCLGAVLQMLLGVVQTKLRVAGPVSDLVVFLELVSLQILFAIALYLLSFAFSRVNVNRFSMHGVYRNRLSRAFLGSVLPHRRADPFTGFGPLDNPPFAPFMKGDRLFPVVNIALNLTRTTHTAWAERKATSFTMTPLACGSAELNNLTTGPSDAGSGTFVATADYAGATSSMDVEGARHGVCLGTALTISGAAVSPNWGYNSSPLAAFVMTMFNVRLGAWLPNPARSALDDLRLGSPRNSQFAIFSELLGVSTDERQSIYLSDGGHFENLGIYEMMRRRCHQILVIDAGQDPDGEFADLGNAIRKAAIDGLGDLRMEPMRILSRSVLAKGKRTDGALGMAVGTLHYPDGTTGRAIYVKPSYLPLIPAAVRAYGAAHPEFPHESTAEQWFTESQFESYRALGEWQMEALAGGVPSNAADHLRLLFDAAWALAAPRSQPLSPAPERQSP